MAKLCGVQIKNVKTFRGMEYPVNYQGMVYLNGQKLGYWSQDGNGAVIDNFEFNSKPIDDIAEEYGKAHGKDMEYWDATSFMAELVNFHCLEKTYKSLSKKGFPTVLFLTDEDEYYQNAYGWLDIKKNDVIQASSLYIEDFKKQTKRKNIKGLVIENVSEFDSCEDLAFSNIA